MKWRFLVDGVRFETNDKEEARLIIQMAKDENLSFKVIERFEP
jgi:hypothetical protein